MTEVIQMRNTKNANHKEHMACPSCGSTLSRVKNTRAGTYAGITGVVRLRICHVCEHRWRTIEITHEKLKAVGIK